MATSVDPIAKVAKSRTFVMLVGTICCGLSYTRLLSNSRSEKTENEDNFG